MKPRFLCYTDGSCKKSEGTPGGWGLFVKRPDGDVIEKSGWALETTTLAMELTAVAEALDCLPEGASATVYSDSKAALDCCERQLPIWRRNGWKNCEESVAPLIRRIDSMLSQKALKVEWTWIRGHNGNPGNEAADRLAAEGARRAKKELEEGSIPKK